MKSVVRPELPTASAGSSQAPTAAVDNSAPVSTHPEPTYKSGKAGLTNQLLAPSRLKTTNPAASYLSLQHRRGNGERIIAPSDLSQSRRQTCKWK